MLVETSLWRLRTAPKLAAQGGFTGWIEHNTRVLWATLVRHGLRGRVLVERRGRGRSAFFTQDRSAPYGKVKGPPGDARTFCWYCVLFN